MSQRVTLVEINIFDRMLPLVSGYLQAYAQSDPDLNRAFDFGRYTTTTRTGADAILRSLVDEDADVYAFSCYLWNMGLLKKVLPGLAEAKPDAHILLGGPQVMRHAKDYLDRRRERMLIANGEGERTFSSFLRQLTETRPDFSRVRGVSFYRDGTLVETEPESRIESLDEIPSPFLSGVFDGEYRMAVMETNRGCPFRCNFCYWGAATNDRVYKYDEARIREEISWLSRHDVPLLYLADANWGMLKRDIELAEHIADCKRERGVPFYVYFAAAKNSPRRVAEIARVFSDAGMLNTQPISMQSLDPDTLEAVDRENIKLSAYGELQEDLNARKISSYIELIWPLPGETLETFKGGVETLCERGAAHLIAYPHMLLHNTPLYRRKEEYGLVTRRVEDEAAEAELVIGTSKVSYRDFVDGLWFFYAVLAVYNTHLLANLGSKLHSEGTLPYAELFTAIAEAVRHDESSELSRFCAESIDETKYYEVKNYPTVYHLVLHRARGWFESLLHRLVSEEELWAVEHNRFLFALDMLQKPFLYTNTPFEPPAYEVEWPLEADPSTRTYRIEIPGRLAHLIPDDAFDAPRPSDSDIPVLVELDHRREQHPYRPEQSAEENASYCSGVIMRIDSVAPRMRARAIEPESS